MLLKFAAALATLVFMLPPVGTPQAQAEPSTPAVFVPAHKHYKLYVRKTGKHYHLVHTFKTHKEAHKIAHKYHKRGYKTKIRTV